jgi:hypothetical protein
VKNKSAQIVLMASVFAPLLLISIFVGKMAFSELYFYPSTANTETLRDIPFINFTEWAYVWYGLPSLIGGIICAVYFRARQQLPIFMPLLIAMIPTFWPLMAEKFPSFAFIDFNFTFIFGIVMVTLDLTKWIIVSIVLWTILKFTVLRVPK